MKRLVLLSLISIFLYTGCKKSVNDNIYHLICKVTGNEPELPLDALITSRKDIILEQGPESFISDVVSIRYFDGEYYLLDGIQQTILVFGKKGDFRRQIGLVGKGPGELTLPQDFAIDTLHRSVNILDSQLRKIFRYSINGNFIEEIQLDGSYAAFHNFDHKNYLWERKVSSVVNYTADGNSLRVAGDNAFMAYGKPGDKQYFFPLSDQQILDGGIRYNRNCFSVFNDGVLFWLLFDNTIYYITENQNVYLYRIDFLDRNIPDHVMELPFQRRIHSLESTNGGSKYRGIIGNVIGINGLIIFSYMSYAGLTFVAWDTESDQNWRLTDSNINRNDVVLFQIAHDKFASIVTDFSALNEAEVILTVFE